ncbi:NrsF family protein [Jiella sonneratiae]|uniref:DUF1109 family protein n=1 Tax=Jiella sonneratiae TaxID=2816856 RepID=A0ABS3IZV2_9HYPH|nr:NrsF family protein [Jiella sonneratiae]MBO0902955.1 DUF1109 family protein [Jiella sonneratiae]
MQTDELIADLAGGSRRHAAGATVPFGAVAAFALLVGFGVFMLLLGPRPDFVASLATPRFDVKFVETGLLAAAAIAVLAGLARPARPWRERLGWFAVPAIVLGLAVAAELASVPEHLWAARAIGSNAKNCLLAIPTIGMPVLAVLLFALSRQAPTRPRLTGAIAGFASAGIAAAFYAAHCTDDSPLFVAIWYPLATLVLVAAGAVAGGRMLRW